MVRPAKGTKKGDKAIQKQKATLIKRYGSEAGRIRFYREIGSAGGKVSCAKGFAVNGRAKEAGRIGGRKSKRGAAQIKLVKEKNGVFVFREIKTDKLITVHAKTKGSAYRVAHRQLNAQYVV